MEKIEKLYWDIKLLIKMILGKWSHKTPLDSIMIYGVTENLYKITYSPFFFVVVTYKRVAVYGKNIKIKK